MPVTNLLIKDSASVRAVLRVALESEGYSVIEAADGKKASVSTASTGRRS